MSAPLPPTPEKRALIDAYETAVRAEAPATEPRRPRRRAGTHPAAWIVLMVSLALLVYGAVERPRWFGFTQPLNEPPAVQEASLRLAVALEAQRIERYRREHGTLPSHVQEAGPPMPDMIYHRGPDGSFELRGTRGAITLTYRSSESLRGFVGRSFDVLTRRAQP